MPGFAADIVDSGAADYDLSDDDGYGWRPVDTWRAPVLPADDRSNTYTLTPAQAQNRRGLFDAYALLRQEPTNPSARGGLRRGPVLRVDAHGFLSGDDAGFLCDACDAGAVATRDRLLPGQELRAGDRLTSANGQFVLVMQTDGNLVLYRQGGAAIWDSATARSGAVRAAMQTDGNFVLYTAQNRPVWDTKTAGRRGAFVAVQNDGNVVAYVGTSPVWTADTAGGVKHTHSSSLFEKIGGAVSSIGSGIAHAASDVVKVAAPLVSIVKAVAPFAQTALSFVPGVGTVVNGAIAAGSALASGKSITDALLDTAAAAVPGGPIAQQAFKAGVAIVKGQPVATAALNAVRDQLPGGLAAKAAFDTAVALAHGQNVQQAALSGARTVAQGALNQGKSQVMDRLSPFATRAFSSVGPRLESVVRQVQTLPTLLSPQVKMVAQAVLRDPKLRSLPIAEVARRMNTNEHDARQGIASVVQAISRAGGRELPHLTQAGDLADRMHTRMSFDDAIAAFASRATRPMFSHNRTIRTVRRFIGARGFVDAGQFVDAGALPPTIQVGSKGAAVSQWQAIIGVKADGIFGPQTKAATIAWQKSRGLVADGIVGPKTWTAALGSPASASPVPSAPVPILSTVLNPPGIGGGVALPALPAPPPVVVSTLANELPMLKVGSTGPAVIKWQQIVGVKADGIFGPNTQAATKAWQAARGLVADGIVGPKTWAAAMTRPAAAPPPPPAPFPGLPPIVTTPVTVPTPVGPIAVPIPIGLSPPPPDVIPPSVTTFPVPPAPTPGGTPPFIPGQVSTIPTPDGPITGVTDRTGTVVTVTQPPITGSPPSSSGGGGAIGALLILGTLFAVGSSGRKGFL